MKPIKCKPSNLVRDQPNLKEKTWKEKKNLGEEKKEQVALLSSLLCFCSAETLNILVSFVIVMLSK
jgi:hypothetical protein